MWNWLKDNWKKVFATSFAMVVVIPLCINCLFKIDFGIELLRAEWDAGDALSFYGMVLAAILAVYGVYLSIDHSNKAYKKELQNQARPFFAIFNLKTKSNHNWLSSDVDEKTTSKEILKEEGYREYKLTDFWYVLENGSIKLSDGPTDEQKKLLDNGGFKWEKNGCLTMCVVSDHICHPMEVENVGNGPALSFRVGFNRAETPKQDKVFAYTIPVKVGEKIMIHIFSEDCGKDSVNLGNYDLEMHYKDIYGNEYHQKHDVRLFYSVERNCPMSSIQFDEKQICVRKENFEYE